MIRALLCDDEALALDRLRALLARVPGVAVERAVTNGRAAIEAIAEARPDALLLDVEMPVLDGFDVVEALARSDAEPPLIVFVTAYPQFAPEAFDSGAIDFLTKPVRIGRLETAMARVARALEDRSARRRLGELMRQLEALRAERRQGAADEDASLWVQRRGELVRVDLARVDWIRAEGDYVRLHLGDDSYLHREPIGDIAARLDPGRFARTHRSYIVNRERVVSLRRGANGGYRLITDRGDELPVGRSYRQQVRDFVTRPSE